MRAGHNAERLQRGPEFVQVCVVALVECQEDAALANRLPEVPGVGPARARVSSEHDIVAAGTKSIDKACEVFVNVEAGHQLDGFSFLSEPLIDLISIAFVEPQGSRYVVSGKHVCVLLEQLINAAVREL